MKRVLSILLTALLLAAAGCAAPEPAESGEEPRLSVVATTYPGYLFASAVTRGVDGVAVERLDTGSVSCLHDYTLSVRDMQKIEGADLLVLNGAGLEDFMSDALAAADAAVVDCSEGVELLETLGHDHQEGDEDHDHGHWDPHYWMNPANAVTAVDNIQTALAGLDPDWARTYGNNAQMARDYLEACDQMVRSILSRWRAGELTVDGEPFDIPGLVTFHDGFQYFAKAYDLPLLAAIEEEAGSEASAGEIAEITVLVQEEQIPVIFTEVNGSDATAKAISRETGCAVAQLSMLMDGPDDQLETYCQGILSNVQTVVNGFAGREVLP